MQGMDWQTVQLPFAAGLLQRSDPRAQPTPFLDIAHDIQFDQLGGVQTRYPYAALAAFVLGGGSLASCRRIVNNGGELLLFTDTALYSWSAELVKWVNKGEHLAIKTTEQSIAVSGDDQLTIDRAELGGVVVYTWSTRSDVVWTTAYDKVTGTMLVPPRARALCCRSRLVVLDTKILLTFVTTDTHSLAMKVIDPADPGAGINGASASLGVAVIGADADTAMYDVVRGGVDTAIFVARMSPTTSYAIYKATTALTLVNVAPARTCDGPITAAITSDGTLLQVVRTNGLNIQGDLITVSSLADTAHVGTALGTVTGPVAEGVQIAAAFRSVTDSGQYRCYVFWDDGFETSNGSIDWSSKSNYVDTAGAHGSQANFIRKLAIASKAFDHGGRIYVHGQFVGESHYGNDAGPGRSLQNTYFLYRDDARLCAKIADGRGGGSELAGSGSGISFRGVGQLPNVASVATNTYAWAASERRVFQFGTGALNFEARCPRDVSITFDSNEARRCARLGLTLYITGGEVLQYDGIKLVELGFHIFPWFFSTGIRTDGGLSLGDGTFAYKVTLRSDNGVGERDRSTTATQGDVPLALGNPEGVRVSVVPLYITHKTNIAIEVWRREANADPAADFYLVTSKDPASSGVNRYLANDPTADTVSVDDGLPDSSLVLLARNPESGTILENLSPPAATIIMASDTRLFLAGVVGDPDRVWYSKQRNDGEVCAFHDALVIPVPADGGAITALGRLNETLVVFRETAIYALPGDGFDNGQGGTNYGPARLISSDVGAVNHESVVFTPSGLVFKSSKGWYLLNRGWSLEYIGGAVSDYDAETPLAAHLVETQHQVRILTKGPDIAPHLVDGNLVVPVTARILVWNYPATPEEGRGQWAEWTIVDALHACLWNGAHVYLTDSGPLVQQVDYTNLTFGIDVETAWIKLADLQGAGRVRWLEILGEVRSEDLTHVRVQLKYNYVETVVDDKRWAVSPASVGAPLQFRHGPRYPQCESVKIRLTAEKQTSVIPDGGGAPVVSYGPPAGEGMKLTGLGLEVGIKRGLHRRLPAEQKQ